ncbi:MAG: FkbM family methyltransferase [Bacteroidota bacterium]
MRLFIEKVFRKIYSGYLFPYSRISYSQNGEDVIIKDLFSSLGIRQPTYLDIGANDPFLISNTYLSYSKGSKGVCVEPNLYLFNKFKRNRKRDTCINAGIAFDEKTEADFYQFPQEANGLGTFSKQDAAFWETTGNDKIGKYKVESVIKTPLVNINEIMRQYFSPHPNFISLDVEGLDLAILQTIDFVKYKPEVFCVETLGYNADNTETKNNQLISFLEGKGYFVYADTYINTIFCRKEVYKALK